MHTETFHPTVSEWYKNPAREVLRTSESLGWEHIRLTSTRILPIVEPQPTPAIDDYAVVMTLSGVTRRTAFTSTGQLLEDLVAPGTAQLIVPQYMGNAAWDSTVISAFIEFSPYLIYKLADETFRGDPHHLHLAPNLHFHDPFLRTIIEALCSELRHDNPFGVLYVASLTQMMTLHLLKTHAKLIVRSNSKLHRYSEKQIRMIDDYIDGHLCEKISLSDLAELLHISVPHFERTFRATFERPPYQYVIERRVERAKQLLSRPYLSLHDVACTCGFANQSHLTRHFKRLVGVTPAHFARHSSR